MKTKEIHSGETYLFVDTTDVNRQHLAGKPFAVSTTVYTHRYHSGGGVANRSIKGFKNVDGEFALAEELEPLPDAPAFAVGLKFYGKYISGHLEIKAVDEAGNALTVKITQETTEWVEPGWNMEHTKFGFERGDYWVEPAFQHDKK